MNATPRVDRARQCDGKVPYADRREARAGRQRTGHRTAGRFGHLTIYRCPWCDWFHLGHAWTDEYMRELELRAGEPRPLPVDRAAAIASSRVLGITVDEALELLRPPAQIIDEAHVIPAAALELLEGINTPGVVVWTTAQEVPRG